MRVDPQTEGVARALLLCMGLLRRRLRQVPVTGELTLPETAALGRLDRGGPGGRGGLARLEQISPQSMGATLGALEARGLVGRRPTPPTAGGSCCRSPRPAGVLKRPAQRPHRAARAGAVAGFTAAELEQLLAAAPLLERLAHHL